MDPIPFLDVVRCDDNSIHISITEHAKYFLKNLNNPVGVVAVTGLPQTGKSSLLNALQGDIKVGFNTESSTKGVWLWHLPEAVEYTKGSNEMFDILLLDFEAITLSSQSYDMTLLFLSVFCSSFLIFNSVGEISHDSFQPLSYLLEIIKNSITQPQEYEKEEQDLIQSQSLINVKSYLPTFLWLLRDYQLNLTIDSYPLSPDTYLEFILNSPPEELENPHERRKRDEIKSCIKEYFIQRYCRCLVSPVVSDTDNMNNLNATLVSEDFYTGINELRSLILEKVKPKTVHGCPVSGKVYLELVERYVETLNKGIFPNIFFTGETLITEIKYQVLKSSEEYYKDRIQNELDKLMLAPCDIESLGILKQACFVETVHFLLETVPLPFSFENKRLFLEESDKLIENLGSMVKGHYKEMISYRKRECERMAEEILERLLQEFSDIEEWDSVKHIQETWSQLALEFDNEAHGFTKYQTYFNCITNMEAPLDIFVQKICNYTEKMEEKQEQQNMKEIQAQLASKVHDCEVLQELCESLGQEYQQSEAQHHQLLSENEELKSQLKSVQKEYRTLTEAMETLKNDMENQDIYTQDSLNGVKDCDFPSSEMRLNFKETLDNKERQIELLERALARYELSQGNNQQGLLVEGTRYPLSETSISNHDELSHSPMNHEVRFSMDEVKALRIELDLLNEKFELAEKEVEVARAHREEKALLMEEQENYLREIKEENERLKNMAQLSHSEANVTDLESKVQLLTQENQRLTQERDILKQQLAEAHEAAVDHSSKEELDQLKRDIEMLRKEKEEAFSKVHHSQPCSCIIL